MLQTEEAIVLRDKSAAQVLVPASGMVDWAYQRIGNGGGWPIPETCDLWKECPHGRLIAKP